MDTAPEPFTPPPCDEDYARLVGQANLDQSSGDCGDEELSTLPADSADGQDLPTRKTYSELREIQRILLNDIRSGDTTPQERSQCARAYRDIEIVRRAIRGKPLMLNVTGKAEAPRRKGAAPILLPPADQAAA